MYTVGVVAEQVHSQVAPVNRLCPSVRSSPPQERALLHPELMTADLILRKEF